LSLSLENKKRVLKLQAEAQMPTDFGLFVMKAYSSKHLDPMPHFALTTENLDLTAAINVRIHSECITGDVFSSNRCECGDQLRFSMNYIGHNGGVIIYLRQEGRGIGIINKLHAYIHQDQGLDTAQANLALGLEIDAREYDDAVTILQSLGISKINLITNNPDKIRALDDAGIEVVSRIPVIIEPKEANAEYLESKKTLFGHLL
jgi:GTP cyclohydrolase II